MAGLTYRPEIDGLRAIAVLTVLFCHAGIAGFSGGYIGVDIFFVISGFLITSLIINDLEQNKFSFIHFWERRCRRILPPLFVVGVMSVIAGFFLYLPLDFSNLGKQIALQAVFASNILFKMQDGYFDVASQTKPFLHTWSLAVEEQFYLLFPAAAFVLWKHRRHRIKQYLWATAIITFIAAAFIVRNSPSSAFYLLPFRAWELLLGSLVAVYARNMKFSAHVNEWITLGGLIAIAVPVFLYNDNTLFPGALALPPCLGAAAIILANTHAPTRIGRVLAMRGLVFIGLISYSLYLWHWPILTYVHYSQLFVFTPAIAVGCMTAAVVLAILTWKFIEQPVRRGVIFPDGRDAFIASFFAIATMATVGLTIVHYKGMPQRLAPEVSQLAAGALDINPHRTDCNKQHPSRFDKGETCQFNPASNHEPNFILWGDSMADAIAPAFYKLTENYNANGYVVTADGCPPILGFELRSKGSFTCALQNEKTLQLIDDKNIKNVFLAGNWTNYLSPSANHAVFEDTSWYESYKKTNPHIISAALRRTIDILKEKGISVYIIIDTPYAPFDPPRYLAMKTMYHAHLLPETIPLKNYKTARTTSIEAFITNNADMKVSYIDPIKNMCNDKTCATRDGSHSLYFNPGHISTHGARMLIPLIEPYFKRVMSEAD